MSLLEIIGLIVGIVAATLTGVWVIFQYIFSKGIDKNRFDVIEAKTVNANCDGHGKDISEVKSDIRDIKNGLNELKEDIICIKSVLIQKYPTSATVFSIKKSPRKLNPLGEELLMKINGEEFLNINKDFFFAKIDDQKPKTALDVEMASNVACTGYTENDIFNNIKNYVYNAQSIIIIGEDNAERSYDITLGDVCFVLSIPLRDMYLNYHPEIMR